MVEAQALQHRAPPRTSGDHQGDWAATTATVTQASPQRCGPCLGPGGSACATEAACPRVEPSWEVGHARCGKEVSKEVLVLGEGHRGPSQVQGCVLSWA